MQGPASYISESLISTVKSSDNLMILSNGKLAEELIKISSILQVPHQAHIFSDVIRASDLTSVNFDNVSHVALVHEESTGLLNPVNELSAYLKKNYPNIVQFVDGQQAFDWIYLKFSDIDFYYSGFSSVIQAFNGISFCIANNASLSKSKGKYLSLSLDLQDQCQYQKENPGQFRFTPPTHLIAAAFAGINEWEEEGVNKRFLRIKEVKRRLVNILSIFGFEFLHDIESTGYSCIALKYPTVKNWDFPLFCAHLKRKGFLVNSEHMKNKDVIELGVAGDITVEDVLLLAKAIEEVLKEMRIPVPIKTG
jgi:2-aminoethylphosphonate-pyruvate transaminase